MEYRRFEDTIVCRIDPKEEIVETIKKVCEAEEVKLAEISGLGAVDEIEVGVYYIAEKQYHSNTFKGYYEITSLTGSATRQNGEVYLHLHMSAGDIHGNVIGGHLNRAIVSATGEIIIRVIHGEVGRKHSDEIGLNLFSF